MTLNRVMIVIFLFTRSGSFRTNYVKLTEARPIYSVWDNNVAQNPKILVFVIIWFTSDTGFSADFSRKLHCATDIFSLRELCNIARPSQQQLSSAGSNCDYHGIQQCVLVLVGVLVLHAIIKSWTWSCRETHVVIDVLSTQDI